MRKTRHSLSGPADPTGSGHFCNPGSQCPVHGDGSAPNGSIRILLLLYNLRIPYAAQRLALRALNERHNRSRRKFPAAPYFSHNSLIQHSVADMNLLYSGLLLRIKVEAQHISRSQAIR